MTPPPPASRRPPGPKGIRLAAAAVATTLAIVGIYAFGLYARQVRYEIAGGDGLVGSFWMESAQRFRYVRILAEGGSLPIPDRRMEAPDGYDPRADTVLQERLYGWSYRALGIDPADVPVEKYVRRLTPAVCLMAIFPLLGVIGVLCDRRGAALFGCLAYAASLPATERAVGQVIYREHVAIPLLGFHLFFLFSALRWGRRRDAALAGGFLLLALLSWKVISFYFLILLGFFALALVRGGGTAARPGLLAALWIPPLVASFAWTSPLSVDLFPTSAPSVLAAALLAVSLADRRAGLPRWGRLVAVVALSAALHAILPQARSYDHAWATLLAKARFLGVKPGDPALLDFHSRHFWSGNYESPSLWLFVRDFALPLLLALPGIVWLARRVRGDGMASPAALALWLLSAFSAAWLAAYKLQALPALMLAVFAGLSWAAPRGRAGAWGQWARRGLLGALVGVMAAGTVAELPEPDAILGRRPRPPETRVPLTQVHTGDALGELAAWLRARTAPDDVVLADFVLSPWLLAYVDRPTVMHCFFESPMVERHREYTLALFDSEERFAAFARSHRARWVVQQAHQALRVDPEMSYRYVADAVRWDPSTAAARLHFDPEGARWFRLAWQNDFFRIYEVLDEARPAPEPAPSPDPLHVLWSRDWMSRRCGGLDPLAAGGRCPDLAGALYDVVWARGQVTVARALLSDGRPEALRLSGARLGEAARAVPDDPGIAIATADWLERMGSHPEAERHRERARVLMGARVPEGAIP
ncbi:hypothetical protein L6R50_01310 [Myxococcota bacterium]|nr:hypothetical protein [Myxococcota bacterium]